MNETIDCCQRHRRVDEDIAPLRKRRIRRDGDALALAALGDELEEHRGFGLIAAHVTDVPEPDGLWHAVIFYTAGRIVADVLAADSRNYTPYADANDVYSGTWREFRTALGATWQPYLDGRTSMTEAALALTRAVTAAHP